jgi:glycosyltransferase involved in cell wall biosynthesis
VRILQLTSDWKWTGPAAPMLELALALEELGHDALLACPEPPPGASGALADKAREAGLPPQLSLSRGRGIDPLRDGPDVARLRRLLDERDVDVVHAWHTRDHALALRAARARRRRGRTRLVRSYKSADTIPAWPWNRWLFGPGTDGLVCVSPGIARRNQRLRGGRPVLGVFGGIDLERFRPGRPQEAVRESLGLSPGQRVVGIVARAQRHRRFDLLLLAAARAMAEDDRLRLLIIGRGTHIAETAVAPAERLGIADRVVFAGYRTDDYVDALRCSDVFTFLVPGSDGGCRALLEAAACGIPAVTSARGALPEIVVAGETGLVVPERSEDLAGAWLSLLRDEARREAMGRAARLRAERCFGREHLAREMLALYERLVAPEQRAREAAVGPAA